MKKYYFDTCIWRDYYENRVDIVSVLINRTFLHTNYSANVLQNVRKLSTFAINLDH